MNEINAVRMETSSDKNEFVQQFDNTKIVQILPKLLKGKMYLVPLYSELYFYKNFNLIEKVGIGNHYLESWRDDIEQSSMKGDHCIIYKIDTKPNRVKTKKSKKTLTYFEKKFGVNFKFNIYYNYSFRISNTEFFLENVSQFKQFSIAELYKYIEDEINDAFLSFIAISLLNKESSILDFNSYILEFSNSFTIYCNTKLFDKFGIGIMDFNFVSLDFLEDNTFLNIKEVLYQKADMKLRNYTWNEKAKYEILSKKSSKTVNNKGEL